MTNTIGGLLLALLSLQTPQASVVGVVRDAGTGEPVGGVEVKLTDLDRGAATDPSGRFELLGVPAGPQHVTVGRIGYAARTVHALVPVQGELEINFSLTIDPVEVAAIDVRPGVEVRGLEPREGFFPPDREISQAAMRVHPMLAEPDGFQALAGGEVVVDPEAPTGVHIRGGRSDQTAYLLDGVPVFSPYHAAGVFSAWNPDALSGLAVFSSAPSPAFPAALSGTISASTREPGRDFRGQGAVSTTQSRIAIDGPLGEGGYLLAFRGGFPSLLAPRGEPEYLRGETGDHLAKTNLPLLGGEVDMLSYGSESELGAFASLGPSPTSVPASGGNHFEWRSRSHGASWVGNVGSYAARAQIWQASFNAASVWSSDRGSVDLTARRADEGLLVAVERFRPGDSATRWLELGLRVERSRTSYRVAQDAQPGEGFGLATSTPVGTLFGSVSQTIRPGLGLELGSTLGVAAGERFVGPRARIRWEPKRALSLSASYVRSHQFAQSLRSSESLAGYVFPADLYVGSGHEGVPIARGDLGVAAVEWTPSASLRLGIQAFSRAMHGVMLVAPAEGGPFSEGSFDVGSGYARGISLDASMGRARYGLLASYGWQAVRLRGRDSAYAPSYGTEHLIDAGAAFFPTATSLVRASVSAGLGRRSSESAGPFEWEACNLLDRGCEFFGAPYLSGAPGGQQLPPYLRVDLGVRKHWHIGVAGRDAAIALYGTLTNVFGRANVLTEILDPETGQHRRIDMRPRSPLVLGVDWRF